METPFASLEQAAPLSLPAPRPSVARVRQLRSVMPCRILGWAHGRCRSQKLMPWRGSSLLSRAQDLRLAGNPTLSQNRKLMERGFPQGSIPQAIGRHCRHRPIAVWFQWSRHNGPLPRRHNTVRRFETAPGVQTQMDYSPYEIAFTGERQRDRSALRTATADGD
jgi:hypothetical protein